MSVTIRDFTKNVEARTQEGLATGILDTAVNVTAQAKSLAPVAFVNGGRLKGSIMWKAGNKSGGNEGSDTLSESTGKLGAVVGSSVEYAVYQEFGTRKMNAQPFLRPAVEIVTQGAGAQEAVARAIENSVKKVAKNA